jgi:hypothetical protein
VNVRAAAKDLVRINEAPNETGFTSCRHDSTYRVVTSLELNEYGRFIKELGYNIQVTLRWKSASGQRWGQQIEGLREAKSPSSFEAGPRSTKVMEIMRLKRACHDTRRAASG